MNTNKKILLGNKDVITKDITDIYLDVELKRTINEIKPERFNNDFNLSDEFDKENNASLKFCVYGTVESKLSDTANVDIKISSKDGDLLYSPKINDVNVVVAKEHTITTTPLSYDGKLSKNIFDFEKTSYYFLFEIDRKELELQISGLTIVPHVKSLILKIDDGVLFDTLEVPFLYIDSNKDIINFGIETTLFDDLGNLINVNNNFPFLYDRHWIKANFNITRLPYVSFEQINEDNTIIVKENVGKFDINVSLDFPSKFGRESIQIELFNDKTVANPNQDYSFSKEIINWNVGEQIKTFTVNVFDDLYFEPTESVSFKLINPENIYIKEPQIFTLVIQDNEIKSVANFVSEKEIIEEGNKTITVEIKLDKPTQVPNQYIDVELNIIETTYDLSKLIFPNPKRISFGASDTTATFTIEILDDPRIVYEDKKIVLNLINPSQNIKIGDVKKHTINITDNYTIKYATFVIPGDRSKGHGILKQAGADIINTPFVPSVLEWQIDTANTTIQSNRGFTDNFNYKLIIENLGETIRTQDVLYVKGQGTILNLNSGLLTTNGQVIEINFTNGFEGFKIQLPANADLDTTTRSYKKVYYKFTFTAENQNPAVNNYVFEDKIVVTKNINSNSWNTIGLTNMSQLLESGDKFGATEKIYYLKTYLNNLYTRKVNSPISCAEKINTQDYQKNNVVVNGLVFLTNTQFPQIGMTTPTIYDNDSRKRIIFEKLESIPTCPAGNRTFNGSVVPGYYLLPV
jgi:hypothetical protein